MVQFYFLSIVANIIGGLVLSATYLDERLPGVSGMKAFFESRPVLRVSIGIVALVAGILKLLSATTGDVPVVGDLLPALAGLVVGIALLFERYKEKSTISEDAQNGVLDGIDKLVIRNKTLLGIAAICVGAVHFLLPGVLFL